MQIPGLRLNLSLEGASGAGPPLAELPWRSTAYEGVDWIDLVGSDGVAVAVADARADAPAGMTVLIRMAPGRGYPRHRHLGPEDVLVLHGGYVDSDGRRFTAGSFVRYPAGSEHEPVALGDVAEPVSGDNAACILFAVAHAGTELVEATTSSEGVT